MILSRYSIVVLIGLFLSAGCNPPPKKVYVAGPHVEEMVTIRASASKGKVGEPIVLYAKRTTSGFVAITAKMLPEGTDWFEQEPPREEAEVAGNLRWLAEPSGLATFNVDYRADGTRTVVFLKAGRYKLKAHSAVWSTPGTDSNEIEIEVED